MSFWVTLREAIKRLLARLLIIKLNEELKPDETTKTQQTEKPEVVQKDSKPNP